MVLIFAKGFVKVKLSVFHFESFLTLGKLSLHQ